jgi:hypothetical protein
LIALLVLAVLTAADDLDPEDLGVLTPHKAIELDPGSTRPDFSHFAIDLHPLTTTEPITLHLTNNFLSLTNLVRVPSGPLIMGVTPFYTDGSHGEVALYRFDLRRGRPPRARAKMIGLLGGPVEIPAMTNVDQVIARKRRVNMAHVPPLPFQSSVAGAEKGPPSFILPLPKGRAETYAQHLDAAAEQSMLQFYQRTGRRNQ